MLLPARLDVHRGRALCHTHEDPLEVARRGAVPLGLPRRGERRSAVVDVERHAGREDGARGGRVVDRLGKVGGELGVEERGERRGRVGGALEGRVGYLGVGLCGEGGGGEALFGGFARGATAEIFSVERFASG